MTGFFHKVIEGEWGISYTDVTEAGQWGRGRRGRGGYCAAISDEEEMGNKVSSFAPECQH